MNLIIVQNVQKMSKRSLSGDIGLLGGDKWWSWDLRCRQRGISRGRRVLLVERGTQELEAELQWIVELLY